MARAPAIPVISRPSFCLSRPLPVSAGASAHLVDEVFLDAQPTIGMNKHEACKRAVAVLPGQGSPLVCEVIDCRDSADLPKAKGHDGYLAIDEDLLHERKLM